MPIEPAVPAAYPPADLPSVGLDRFVALRDLEAPARERIHPVAWSYIARGAEDERTLACDQEAWDRIRLRPRVLADVSDVRLGRTILGRSISMPVGIVPGQPGVEKTLSILRQEVGRALSLLGASSVDDVRRDHVVVRDGCS